MSCPFSEVSTASVVAQASEEDANIEIIGRKQKKYFRGRRRSGMSLRFASTTLKIDSSSAPFSRYGDGVAVGEVGKVDDSPSHISAELTASTVAALNTVSKQVTDNGKIDQNQKTYFRRRRSNDVSLRSAASIFKHGPTARSVPFEQFSRGLILTEVENTGNRSNTVSVRLNCKQFWEPKLSITLFCKACNFMLTYKFQSLILLAVIKSGDKIMLIV